MKNREPFYRVIMQCDMGNFLNTRSAISVLVKIGGGGFLLIGETVSQLFTLSQRKVFCVKAVNKNETRVLYFNVILAVFI